MTMEIIWVFNNWSTFLIVVVVKRMMYLLLLFTFRADPNIGACDNDYDIDIGNMQEMKII